MKRIFLIAFILLPLSASAVEIYPVQPTLWQRVIDRIENCTFHISCYLQPSFGTTLTTINATDLIKDSRATINTNFTNLNSGKIENSTTSVQSITTLSNLASIGTITTGVWNGTPITAPYGGTGSTTLSSNQVLLGNGTGILKTVSGLGTSGQVLTSAGAGSPPTWTSTVVDQSIAYNWTAQHTFSSAYITLASTTNATTTSLYVSGVLTNVFPQATSTTFTSSGTWGKPTGVSRVKVRVIGGGGGGGGAPSTGGGGAGGGAGAYCEAIVSVTGNVTVTVGSGGAGGLSTPADGSAGGSSSFAGAVTVTAAGGSGGAKSFDNLTTGGAGGACTNANQVSITGSTGGSGSDSGTYFNSGDGGSNPMGMGGNGSFCSALANDSGQAGTGFGGGGSGACANNSNTAGSAGSAGAVIVEWVQTTPY